MAGTGNLWAIVLAAGEGTRLRSLTTHESGVVVPKQFCSFLGGRSMLRCAFDRAERIVPPQRIVTIVASHQKEWWCPELKDRNPENVIVQPENLGTASGILLPLLNIFLRDAQATVLIVPSDHHVDDEEILEKAILRSTDKILKEGKRVVLIGMEPETPDTGYGWIVPEILSDDIVRPVRSFVEKPPLSVAEDLMKQGGLWNSFMFVATAGTLLGLYRQILPDLLFSFLKHLGGASGMWTQEKIAAVYQGLPIADFSKDLLERAVDHLSVVAVPPCGWSDLGTPERVEQCLRHAEERAEARLRESLHERLIVLPRRANG